MGHPPYTQSSHIIITITILSSSSIIIITITRIMIIDHSHQSLQNWATLRRPQDPRASTRMPASPTEEEAASLFKEDHDPTLSRSCLCLFSCLCHCLCQGRRGSFVHQGNQIRSSCSRHCHCRHGDICDLFVC